MAQTTTTTTETSTNGKGKREPKALTPIDAAKKIATILEPLTLGEKKRVLAFVTDEVNEAAAKVSAD